MWEFPEFINIPLAEVIDSFVAWLLKTCGGLFDLLGFILLKFLVYVEDFFTWLPWPVVLAGLILLGWKTSGRWRLGIVVAVMVFIIGSFGYWEMAMKTLSLIICAVLVSLALGIPIGILTAFSDRMEIVIRPILDAMQTTPSFVYLIPVMMFFGLGKVPALFATIIYSMPPIIRLTNVGIREVPRGLVEASSAFGASRMQTLSKIQLPLARSTILVGINQTTMMALAMVVIASMIGAKGLGMEVLISINRIEVGRGIEAGLSIVLLAIGIDRLLNAMASQRKK